MSFINRRQFSVLSAAALAGNAAHAQTRRPELAKILAPYPAGGTFDMISRALAEAMRGDLAETVVVENKVGAAGRIAIDALRQAPADGLTLMANAAGVVTLFPYTFKQISYNPFTDIAMISLTNRLEFSYSVGPGVPAEVKTLKDYLAWVKANPLQANFGTPASGSPMHFIGQLLGRESGVELSAVQYRGGGPTLTDLMAGHVPAASMTVHDVIPQLGTGKIRMLATSGVTRNKLTPQVPTFAEQGFPSLTHQDWYGVFVHGKTPLDVQERLSAMVRKALATQPLMNTFSKLYIEPVAATPAECAKLLRENNAKWAGIVKSLGFEAEA